MNCTSKRQSCMVKRVAAVLRHGNETESMNQSLQYWWLIAGLLGSVLLAGSAGAGEASNTVNVFAGNTHFACDLYGRLNSREGNLFFSPYSISTCLAMVEAGARGNTASQLAKVMHFPGEPLPFQTASGDLQRQLNGARKAGEVELDVANVLWGQRGQSFLPAFLDS